MSVDNIFQNIYNCIKQNREMYTGLEQLGGGHSRWYFHFLVEYPFKNCSIYILFTYTAVYQLNVEPQYVENHFNIQHLFKLNLKLFHLIKLTIC